MGGVTSKFLLDLFNPTTQPGPEPHHLLLHLLHLALQLLDNLILLPHHKPHPRHLIQRLLQLHLHPIQLKPLVLEHAFTLLDLLLKGFYLDLVLGLLLLEAVDLGAEGFEFFGGVGVEGGGGVQGEGGGHGVRVTLVVVADWVEGAFVAVVVQVVVRNGVVVVVHVDVLLRLVLVKIGLPIPIILLIVLPFIELLPLLLQPIIPMNRSPLRHIVPTSQRRRPPELLQFFHHLPGLIVIITELLQGHIDIGHDFSINQNV